MIIALTLAGGIGLFLLGMAMMTDGLKLAAGDGLRMMLNSWTRSNARGLLTGFLMTAIVQSSSAVTVATVGFVNAGLLSLQQAIWVIFGTNVGTTITGWLVALIGIRLDISSLALPLLGVGMMIRLAARQNARRNGIGTALAGFGIFFLGISVLQDGFTGLTADFRLPEQLDGGVLLVLAFTSLGVVLTILTQSSSAAIAIILTASAGAVLPLDLAAASVIGANLGTTSTAIFSTIGATAAAKRVAAAHVLFNLLTGAVALLLLFPLLQSSLFIIGLVGGADNTAAVLAIFHSLFNCLGVMLIWPLSGRLVDFLSRRFVTQDEEIGRPQFLDRTLIDMPSMALSALVHELLRMEKLALELTRAQIGRRHALSSDDETVQRGLLNLGDRIRLFLDDLSTSAQPKDQTGALPDLIRALQHLEDLVQLADNFPNLASAGRESADNPDLVKLRQLVREALDADGWISEEGDPVLEGVESNYQAAKAALLTAAASGRISIASLDNALNEAQILRRALYSARKSRRRISRWHMLIESGASSDKDDQEQGEHGQPAQNT